MKKLMKIIGIVVAVVVALFIAAVVALTLFFDPNEYRDDIARYVQEQTGRELSIEGDLSLSYFPWIGIEIGKVSLSNAAGFEDKPFARVERAGVAVEVLPLLRKELVMDEVILEGLQLHLARNQKGVGNWEGLVKSEPEAEQQPQPEDAKPALARFDVSGVRVSDSQIEWDDRQSGTHIQLRDLNLRTGRLGGGDAVPVELDFDFLQDPKAPPRHFELQAKVDLNLEQGTVAVNDLTGELAGLVSVQATLNGEGLNDQPKFSGHFAVDEFVPRKLLRELDIEAPLSADDTVLGKAALKSDFTATTQRAALSNLQIAVDDTKLTGELAVEDFATTALRFDLSIDEINLDRYLPPPPPDEQKSNEQKSSEQKGSGAGAGQSSTAEEPDLIPVETLRGLNLAGKLHIGKLQAYNIKSQKIEVTVDAKQGDVRIQPAKAQLYGGSYSGSTRIDARGAQAKVFLEEKLEGVQAQPLFKDAADTDLISGTANLSANLRSTGNKLSQIKRSLNGDMAMAFTDGSVNGVNIPLMIRKAAAKLQGQPAPADEAEKTDFAELTGTATVNNGVVNNNDLSLKSPLLRVEGSGSANLVQEQVDYTVKAVIVASLEGQGGAALEKLKGVPIPVRVSGSFDDPKFSVDVAQVLTEQQKQRLEQKVDEEKQKLREKAEEKLQDKLKDKLPGLNDLFNR